VSGVLRMSGVLRVVAPGLFTTIQDLGRPHAMAAGVPPGGAMDRFAHTAANLLVGNDVSAASLECTLFGPTLAFDSACVIAIAGADFEPRINGIAVPMWTAIAVREGDELGFGKRHELALLPPYRDRTLHAIPGPHIGRLSAPSREALFSSTFTVGIDSNRMGYRLEGPTLDAAGDELLSFAVVAGLVQLPSGGRPILLMADHGTAGGYPAIATVATASMPIAAQMAPGDELRLAETSIESALAMRASQRVALDSIS
jgi:antagonist of KipI